MARFMILLCAIGIIGCTFKRAAPQPMPTVEVWFDEPIQKATGLNWPRDGQSWADSNGIDSDAQIVLHFPSGETYSSPSKATILHQKNGVISVVVVTPLAETLTFADALARVEAFT
jgi:hypothetical protein